MSRWCATSCRVGLVPRVASSHFWLYAVLPDASSMAAVVHIVSLVCHAAPACFASYRTCPACPPHLLLQYVSVLVMSRYLSLRCGWARSSQTAVGGEVTGRGDSRSMRAGGDGPSCHECSGRPMAQPTFSPAQCREDMRPPLPAPGCGVHVGGRGDAPPPPPSPSGFFPVGPPCAARTAQSPRRLAPALGIRCASRRG